MGILEIRNTESIYNNLENKDIIYLNDEGIRCIEIWKPIPGYENFYQASNLGRIKSLEEKRFMPVNNAYANYKERIIRQSKTKDGYLKVTLSKKIKKCFLSHRLVGLTFIDNPQNKAEINHIKGVKSDNRCWMLEWCNSNENVQHAYDYKLLQPKKGVKNGASKLTEKEVLEIRKIGSSMYKKDIAKKYNVGSSTVSRILSNTNWKHI